MAFMTPEVCRMDCYHITHNGGLTDIVPVDLFTLSEYVEAYLSLPGDSCEISLESGYYARLSAPGYLDATDWCGPYATAEEAMAELRDTYEIDADGNCVPT